MIVLYNILWCLFAYMIGSLNFSIILTKLTKKGDIKKVGSGNAGATNAMRSYGPKFGFLIFILDTSKSFWLGFSLGLLQKNVYAFEGLIPQLILVFVIIGHIFPIYFKFRGGKGAATLLGMIASISLFLAIIGAAIFIIIVWITKYVSLGSITVPYILAAISFACPQFNGMDTTIIADPFWYNPLFLFIGAAIVAASHWENIIKLAKKTESKISLDLFKDKKYNQKIYENIKFEKENNDSVFVDTEKLKYRKNDNSLIEDATKENKF